MEIAIKTQGRSRLDLLSAVENIVELAKDSQLSPEFYHKAGHFIKHLSEKHLSGDQIENIASHYAIDAILHGNDVPTTSNLMPHCDSERIKNTSSRAIGFGR